MSIILDPNALPLPDDVRAAAEKATPLVVLCDEANAPRLPVEKGGIRYAVTYPKERYILRLPCRATILCTEAQSSMSCLGRFDGGVIVVRNSGTTKQTTVSYRPRELSADAPPAVPAGQTPKPDSAIKVLDPPEPVDPKEPTPLIEPKGEPEPKPKGKRQPKPKG